MKYDFIDASLVFEGEEGSMPVPPEDAVVANNLPDEYRYATLHKQMADRYDPVLYDVATRYVENWVTNSHFGRWALFTGDSGRGKTWAAAAVMNEIQRVYGSGRRVSAVWFPVAWKLRMLFDHQHFRNKESYRELYNRLHESELVVVDDLLHVAEYPSAKEFVYGLLDYRAQHRRATILTANALIAPGDWSHLEKAFSTPFARRIRQKAEGYTVVL